MSEKSFKEEFLKRGFNKGIKRERKSELDDYILEINELYEEGYSLKTIHSFLVEEKELSMSLTTFSSAFRRLREKKDLIKTKRKALKMKNKTLIYILLFSLFSSISFAAVDCSDPKNRPRFIGGGL